MKEFVYEIYKMSRDIIEELQFKELDSINRNFIVSMRSGCETYDKANRDFLERWLKERDSE